MGRNPKISVTAVLIVLASAACAGPSAPPSAGPGAGPTLSATIAPASPSPSASAPSAMALPAPLSLPSSGRILFTVEGAGEDRPAYLDPAGLHEIPAEPDTSMAHAVWASADTIIFDSERAGGRHLFRMGVDGKDVAQLTSGGVEERASVSPDGSKIAYASYVDSFQGADLGLHIANADGTNARALTARGQTGAKGSATSPAFSPDGMWIAFERSIDPDAGVGGLFLIRTDGTGLRRLTDDSLGAGYPRWSPDGKRILFSQRVDAITFAPGPLWVVDIASGARSPLTDPADRGSSFEGDWSPDGLQIAYLHFSPDAGAVELRVMTIGAKGSTTLWSAPDRGTETPDWGP